MDKNTIIPEKTLKKISHNENFIFICKDFSSFEKCFLFKKNSLISPIPITKLIDFIKNSLNNIKYTFANIELNNSFVKNVNTNEKIYLTETENHILLKLFNEKNVKKKLIERDALKIKQELNTSSIESHLNRIRKKLKKINSKFTVSSKEKDVYLEVFNLDK